MRTRVCSEYDVPSILRCVDDEIASGLRPTLAVVFCSVAHDFSALGRQLGERGMDVVGVTTAGEVANAGLFDESCAVMLMEADPEAFAVRLKARTNGEAMSGLAQQLGREAAERFDRPVMFTFVAGVRANGEDVMEGIRAGAGPSLSLYGGMAGDDLLMENTYVFSGEEATEEGVIGLVLDGDRFEVQGIATSGWQPIGIEKTVTRSEANLVYTIDGESALDVYHKYLGQRQIIIEASGVQYPLSVRRQDGSEVIRAPLLYDPEQDAMIFAGNVPQGAKVKFCIPPSLDIVEQVVEEASEMQRRLPDADAVFLVSCIARHMALGPLSADEIQGLYDLWEAPMLGYFSYGEIGAGDAAHCDFHTETCILVALRESEA